MCTMCTQYTIKNTSTHCSTDQSIAHSTEPSAAAASAPAYQINKRKEQDKYISAQQRTAPDDFTSLVEEFMHESGFKEKERTKLKPFFPRKRSR